MCQWAGGPAGVAPCRPARPESRGTPPPLPRSAHAYPPLSCHAAGLTGRRRACSSTSKCSQPWPTRLVRAAACRLHCHCCRCAALHVFCTHPVHCAALTLLLPSLPSQPTGLTTWPTPSVPTQPSTLCELSCGCRMCACAAPLPLLRLPSLLLTWGRARAAQPCGSLRLGACLWLQRACSHLSISAASRPPPAPSSWQHSSVQMSSEVPIWILAVGGAGLVLGALRWAAATGGACRSLGALRVCSDGWPFGGAGLALPGGLDVGTRACQSRAGAAAAALLCRQGTAAAAAPRRAPSLLASTRGRGLAPSSSSGLATYGYKIMRILGVKMTRLSNSRGGCGPVRPGCVQHTGLVCRAAWCSCGLVQPCQPPPCAGRNRSPLPPRALSLLYARICDRDQRRHHCFHWLSVWAAHFHDALPGGRRGGHR